jgi:biotin-(acetyl-CoA carboxylase) ligase
VILGIGLNVEVVPEIARDKFTPKAGCLKDCFESVVLSSVFYKLINSLYANYMLVKNNYTKTLHNLYIERSFVMGKNCAFYSMDVNHPDFIGRVSGFGSDLELMFENKTQPIRHGRLEILS